MNNQTHVSDFYLLHLAKVAEHSAWHVRRIVRTHLHAWSLSELSQAAEPGVTELLSNVLRHVPDRRCTITISRLDHDSVRIEVQDTNPALPRVHVPNGWAEEGGRGLVLLTAIARTWDAERTPTGKTVWFELEQG